MTGPVPVQVECEHCGRARDLDELLEVVEVRSGALFHLCKPSVGRECFRLGTRSAVEHRIRDASPRRHR